MKSNRPPSTVPESPETLAAQLQMLVEGKRQAVLITWGEAIPELPGGVELLNTGLGVFVFNPELINQRLILEAINKDEVGLLLGYGVARKPAPGRELGAVTLRNRNGTEKQSVVVDDNTLEQAIHAANERAEPGDKVQLEKDTRVLADRVRDLTERDLKIYPIDSAALRQQVETAAKDNGNSVAVPTHYVTRNKEIIGAIGLSILPVARIWLHTDKVKAHDSLEVVRVLAGSLSMSGHRALAVVINRQSPFLQVKERFGFISNDNDVIAVKIL